MSPFRNILRLVLGDLVAKTLNFFAFIFLARTLGVRGYGIIEFSIAILTYLLLLADGGLELWATREVARGKELRGLVARVVPLRFALAAFIFVGLLSASPLLPDYPGLRPVLIGFAITLFVQAVDLKWVFMGAERMTRTGLGLAVAQLVFAVAVFSLVRGPAEIVWIPLFRVVGDAAMTIYFAWLFVGPHGNIRLDFRPRGTIAILRPALTMGTSRGLAFMSYNFDSVLLGMMIGPLAVGLYGAAYKPVTVALAIPVTYFIGLFPVLSRTHGQSEEAFRQVVTRSLRLAAAAALPISVGTFFLAAPIIDLLFGSAYHDSIPALQLLAWSAALVILRGTFRQALNAAGRQGIDLFCAALGTGVNLVLNLVLIPRFGIEGAASATIASEVVWLGAATVTFGRSIARVRLVSALWRPVAAAALMGAFLALGTGLFWPLRAALACLIYAGTLFALDPVVRDWRRQLALQRRTRDGGSDEPGRRA